MATTYIKIASTSVPSGGASAITFSSIPATYTDLKLVISARTDYAGVNDYLKVTINGNGSSISQRFIYGGGNTQGSGSYGSPANVILSTLNGANSTASTFSNGELYFPNYASSTYKSIFTDDVTETNAAATQMDMYAALWSNTSAITTILLNPYYGTIFSQYTTATLYGIKNA